MFQILFGVVCYLEVLVIVELTGEDDFQNVDPRSDPLSEPVNRLIDGAHSRRPKIATVKTATLGPAFRD